MWRGKGRWALLVTLVPACANIISSDDLHRVECVGPCASEGAGGSAPVSDASNDAAEATADARPPVDASDASIDAVDDDVGAFPPGDASVDVVDAIADSGSEGDAPAADSSAVRDASTDVVDAALDSRPEGAACIDVSTGLVGHWTMDTSAANQIPDVSGHQSPATMMGFSGSVLVPGKFGYALSYPANGSAYLAVPTLALDQTPGGANSVSMWFYRNATNVDDVLVMIPNNPRYDLWLTQKTHTSLCINTGGSDCFGVADDGLTGRWVHVVAVFANGPITNGKLYIDGVERQATCVVDTGFGACTRSGTASQPVDFGGVSDFFYRGMLDEVRVFRRALTAGEVKVLAAGTACP
jgi:hypothetical protein